MTSSSTRLRLGAALLAGALAVAVGLTTPAFAHGGGHGGRGGSGGSTQGKSYSNPDGGGVDKPYRAAGQEAKSQGSSDWDGNNGCGNDDDREDDNNGWCGRHKDHDQAKVQAKSFTAPTCSATCADHADKVKALRAAKVESDDHDTAEVKDVSFVLDENVSRCRRERIAVNRVEKEFCSCDHLVAPSDTLAAQSVKDFEAKKAEVMAAKAAAPVPATETVAAPVVLGTETTRAATPAGSEVAAAAATTAAAPAAAPATNGLPTEVLGVSLNRGAPVGTGATADTNGNVLGSVASLAVTGTDSLTLLLMAIALIAIGLIVSRYSARRSS
jgi:hypothetical protein